MKISRADKVMTLSMAHFSTGAKNGIKKSHDTFMSWLFKILENRRLVYFASFLKVLLGFSTTSTISSQLQQSPESMHFLTFFESFMCLL